MAKATDSPVDAQDQQSAVHAAELRRFRSASWVALTLSLSALAAMLTWGNAPRPVVDRMNLLLAPVVMAAFGVLGWALWRFRKKCGAWPGQIAQHHD